MEKTLGISLVSSYVPRRCGIATFSNDLANSMKNLTTGEYQINISALNDNPEGYKYSSDVNFEIKDKSINDFKEAANYLNLSDSDVINIQHEFGLYGGEGGSNILYLINKLNKPIVTTLHTVLENPSGEELRVLQEIGKRSSYLVVQSRRSFEMLEKTVKIPKRKIRFIPHGAHDVPFLDPAFYKDKFKLSGKKVILTFGLVGPGKGFEDAIKALQFVLEKYNDAVLVILGATHPNVKKEFGESYRNSLENLVKNSGLENNVMFINRFVDTKELLEYILMSDVYVSPYKNKVQAVSGTLTYALACGKAIVSTPYWYAEELLQDEKGVLVPFSDPEAMGNAIAGLLLDENKRNRLRKNAYDAGRELTWENVGKQYTEIFLKAAEDFKTPKSFPVISTLNNILPSLPDINLTHMKNMTDDTGIFQHATYSIPNPKHGYCVDDNVRALHVAVMHKINSNDDTIDPYINRYLQFVYHSFNEDKGLFRNFMSYDRKWLEEEGSEDSNGRVIYVLGYLIRHIKSHSILGLTKNLFDNSIKNMAEVKSPRSIAYIIFGCIFYLQKFSGASEIKNILNKLSHRLYECYVNTRTDDWLWFENSLTYANARLSQALIMSGKSLNRKEYTIAGLESLKWLYDNLYDKEKKYLSLIGNAGWFVKGQSKSKYDQQPVEIPGLIDACYEAYLATNDNMWISNIGTAFSWFLGNNDRQEPMIDFTSGGCYDGLTSTKLNDNQGAESVLSWLSSLYKMIDISQKLQLNKKENTKKIFREYLSNVV
ncbi:MAG TPA: glycosyltransferase family 4 protein [Ignavibacteria bacterium]|nr:glycosyltransferase family 4 protein [Ignavibacteria bacterium]